MGTSFEFLFKEWDVIWQAKVTFAIAIAIVGGAIYWAFSWKDDGVIADLHQRIALRDDQIKDLKDKVGTASPDAIKAQLDSLRAQIRALGPRHLTAEQINKLTEILGRMNGTVSIEQDMAATDARALAVGLNSVFRNAGWQVINGMVGGPSNPPPEGIGIIVPDPSVLTETQKLVVDAMKKSGLEYAIQKGTGASIPGQQSPDITILITQKTI